jgi:RNA polymerase sigma-70 factor (ECF subfamily)
MARAAAPMFSGFRVSTSTTVNLEFRSTAYYQLSGTFPARHVNDEWSRLQHFEDLYAELSGRLYRFAIRMGGSAAVADDVVQEAFLAVIRGTHGHRPELGPLPHYLFGMARNLVRQSLRGRIGQDEIQEDVAAPEDQTDPLEGLARSERVDRVRQAVLSLPIHYREVVVLCDLEETSYQDAAAALDCAVGTVRSRLHRGRELLLGKLQEVRCLT